MRWIQSRVGELSLYPLADNGIVLAALASHSGPHRRRGALSYPHVDDVAKFKDPEQDRQQDKGNGQDRLKRFLPSLSRQTSVSQCVWVSFWTMSFIFDTRPVFHIITPTTRVPTYVSQGDLSSYDDPLLESQEVLLGGSPGGYVREIAAGHP
jgi:hypothetical protein